MKKLLLFSLLFLGIISNSVAVEIKKDATPVIYAVMVDATDGYTAETGITSPTVYYVKQGGSATSLGSPTWAELDATNMPGLYSLTLTAAMTDTAGNLVVYISKAGSRAFRKSVDIVTNLESDTKTDTAAILADTGTDGVVLANDAITAAKIAASAITASEAPNLDAAISTRSTLTAANVWETNISAYAGAGYAGTYLKSLYDGQNWNVWDDGTRTLTAIDEDSTTLDLNATTVGGLTTWDKSGYSLSAAGLADFFDTDSGTTYAASVAGSVVKEISDNASGSGATAAEVWGYTTRTLTALDEDTTTLDLNATTIGALTTWDKSGYSLSAAAITALWQENISAYSGAGYAGTYVKGIYDKLPAGNMLSSTTWTDTKAGYLDEAISGIDDNPWDAVARTLTAGTNIVLAKGTGITGFNDIAATDVWAAATRTLTAIDEDSTTLDINATTVGGLTTWDKTGYSLASSQTFNMTGNITGNLSGSVGSVTTVSDKTGYSLSAAGIDSIWDEVQSGHTTAGTFGKYVDAQISAVSAPTSAQVADAVWDEAISGHLTAGTTGAKLNSAAAAGDPWATDISTGYTGQAGEYMRNIKDATDGDKEAGAYTGIETMIKTNR